MTLPSLPVPDLQISTLQHAYRTGLTPSALIAQLLPHLAAQDCDSNDPASHHVWISRFSDDVLLQMAQRLDGVDPASLPLYGIPFAVKDNIDVAGLPTTAACPAYAYQPAEHAYVVQQLIAAGAIPLGKTNLDQFATGLNGTRSPYGIATNSINPDYIAGGSSSGSALAVALGLASFALGTDTAGSGRVPAAFNGLVGVKPSCGLLSTTGVVPACRTLDCVSIFALNTADAAVILAVAAQFDAADSYAKKIAKPIPQAFRVIGIPHADQLNFFGDARYAALFEQAKADALAQGLQLVEIDFAPFLAAAALLYSGPWVAERYQVLAELLTRQPEAVLPVIRQIVAPALQMSAAQTFAAFYRLADLKRACDQIISTVDAILTPTTGTIYTLAQMLADPVQLNSNLGYYTNFMNLLDYAAIAIPAGQRDDGLPFGITLFASSGQDWNLLDLAARWSTAAQQHLGASHDDPLIQLVVCGAHLSGMALNHQLLDRGGVLVKATESAPIYRFYALAGGPPFRPGMVRVASNGVAIPVEVWALSAAGFGDFVSQIPSPLGIGKVVLADDSVVSGFICEPYALDGATDISSLGGWRNYIASLG
jgi:allophanate hydrolase